MEPKPLSQLFPALGTGNKVTLQKKMSKIRVRVTHIPASKSKKSNKDIPRVKTIFGLAKPEDGRSDPHPPQVRMFGAGPKEVRFWLSAVPPAAAAAGAKVPTKSPKSPDPRCLAILTSLFSTTSVPVSLS